MKKIYYLGGYTLIELMVGITIFVILGTIVSGIVLYSSRNSSKSESMSKVRERMDFAVQVMTRQLRYAKGIVSCPPGFGVPSQIVNYTDQNNNPSYFSIVDNGSMDYIASGSASLNLTGNDIQVINAAFTCTEETTNTPASVRIKFTAKTAPTVTGVQSDEISVDTLVTLRNK